MKCYIITKSVRFFEKKVYFLSKKTSDYVLGFLKICIVFNFEEALAIALIFVFDDKNDGFCFQIDLLINKD